MTFKIVKPIIRPISEQLAHLATIVDESTPFKRQTNRALRQLVADGKVIVWEDGTIQHISTMK